MSLWDDMRADAPEFLADFGREITFRGKKLIVILDNNAVNDELAVGGVNLHGVVGAGENPDVVLLVHGDTGHMAEVDARRALGPGGVHLIPRGEVDLGVFGFGGRGLL